MASGPIISWQIDVETMETVTDFIFLGFKITVDGDCSHEIKRCLLLGRKAVTNLGSILKSRDITLPAKVHPVKAMVFPVVMHRCESWTIMKAECPRSDAFELWCWRRLLRVPWIARRSEQSILKEINSEYSLQGPMLKLQYFGHLIWTADSLENTLILGKIEGRSRRGWRRMRWLDGITDSVDMIEMVRWQTPRDGEGRGRLMCCSPWGLKELDVTKWLSNNQNGNLNEASTNICGSHLFYYMLTLLCSSSWVPRVPHNVVQKSPSSLVLVFHRWEIQSVNHLVKGGILHR